MPVSRLVGSRLAPSFLGLAALLAGLTTAEAAPRTDVSIGMAVEPPGLDPTIAAPVAIGQVTWQNVFQGLVRIDRDGTIKPQLARAWTISPDGLTYTFDLETGVTFHNGVPFDAGTARFTLDRARGPQSVNSQKAFFTVIDRIDTPDAKTLVLHLAKPAGNLLYWLGWPTSVMVEPSSAEADKTAPIGTGPFKFASWRRGDRVELVRNPDYWDKAHGPALDKAIFRFIGDPQAEASALKAGDVDAFPEFVAPEMFPQLQADKAFVTVVGTTGLKVVAGMNDGRKPFSDVRVRRALMMAVDRKLLIDGANSGFGTPIGSHFAPADPGYVDLAGALPYDPAKAKALLAEAGYASGLSFTIKVPQMAYATRSAEILQAMFQDVGVAMTIAPTEFPAQWLPEVFMARNFDMTIIAHAEPLDIGIYARPGYYFNYQNPAFNAAVASAEAQSDTSRRAADYAGAQRILAEDVPALYLYVMPKLGVWSTKLDGLWANEPIPSNDLTEVHWKD